MSIRIPLLCACFSLGIMALAQSEPPSPFRKGRFYASGAISWKTEDYDLKDKKQWNLEPQVGYFIIDNVAVGIGGVVGVNDFNYVQDNLALGTTTYNNKETTWGAMGPVVRGHIGGPRVSAFGQLGGYFGSIEQNGDNNLNTGGAVSKINQQGSFQLYDFGAGLAWYYKQTVGLELIAHYYLGYSQTSQTITDDTGEATTYPKARNNADGGGASVGLVFLFGLSKGKAKTDGAPE